MCVREGGRGGETERESEREKMRGRIKEGKREKDCTESDLYRGKAAAEQNEYSRIESLSFLNTIVLHIVYHT